MNGLHVIKALKSQYLDIKIIILTLHDTEEYIHAALEAGANGYLLKDSCYGDLKEALLAVMKNQTPLSPSVSSKIIDVFLNEDHPKKVTTTWESLTPREREHLKLIAESNSNKKIAEYLCISIKTVEKHRANLMKKLGMHSATELTVYAVKKGLVNK
jgi:DNA-binding NarL/FixJ family response regulator